MILASATGCGSAAETVRRHGGAGVDASSDDEASGRGRPSYAGPVGPGGFDPLSLRPLYTEHVGQLTATANNPAPLRMIGTDLGSSFERDGKLVFLFGDTLGDADKDSAAFGPTSLPADGSVPKLSWLMNGGSYQPLTLPGIDLGTMNVPVEGVAVGATTYVFFATGFGVEQPGTYARSTLAHASGVALGSLTIDHSVPSQKFVNVSVVQEGATCHVYGSGKYRASSVYHAQVDCGAIADRSAWRYEDGSGALSTSEAAAAPLIDRSCVGELSVRKHPTLGMYMMAYNCLEPRGEWLHLAASPSGPWGAPILMYDPGEGYGRFMHRKVSDAGYDDGLSGFGVEEEYGGDYAPYLIPQYFRDEGGGVYSIVYTLSSWNPYQTHLMRTYLASPGATRAQPIAGQGLPKSSLVNGDFAAGLSGWQSAGDSFVTFEIAPGRSAVSTFGSKGDATQGAIWQDFTVDATTSELDFTVHGGDGARVYLMYGGDVVRSVHGRRSNTELAVRWHLDELRGKTVRLLVEDQSSAPWGFVGASGFRFQ